MASPHPRGRLADAERRAAGVEARDRLVGEWRAERRIGRERRAVAQGTLRASCGSRACGPRRSRPVICSHRLATWEDGLTALVRLAARVSPWPLATAGPRHRVRCRCGP